MIWRGLLILPFALALGGCNNACDFTQRCNGNSVEVCGDGPDQVVNRTSHSFPCAASDVCLAVDDQSAFCVRAPATKCDDSFVPVCAKDVLELCSAELYTQPVSYPTRFVISDDCAKAGATCAPDAAGATCK